MRTLIGSEAADSARGRGGCRVKRQPVDRLLLMPGVVLVEFRPGLEAAAQDVDQSVGQLPKCVVLSDVPCSHDVVVGAGDTR